MAIDLKYPICRALVLDSVGDLFLYLVADCMCCNPVFGLVLYSKAKTKEIDSCFVQARYENHVIKIVLPSQNCVAKVSGGGVSAWIRNAGMGRAELHIESPTNTWDFQLSGIEPLKKTRELL